MYFVLGIVIIVYIGLGILLVAKNKKLRKELRKTEALYVHFKHAATDKDMEILDEAR